MCCMKPYCTEFDVQQYLFFCQTIFAENCDRASSGGGVICSDYVTSEPTLYGIIQYCCVLSLTYNSRLQLHTPVVSAHICQIRTSGIYHIIVIIESPKPHRVQELGSHLESGQSMLQLARLCYSSRSEEGQWEHSYRFCVCILVYIYVFVTVIYEAPNPHHV